MGQGHDGRLKYERVSDSNISTAWTSFCWGCSATGSQAGKNMIVMRTSNRRRRAWWSARKRSTTSEQQADRHAEGSGCVRTCSGAHLQRY